MKAQRHGDVRTRSPSEKIRDQRSEWHRDPYRPPHGNSHENRLSRRSLSPPEVKLSRRIVIGDRRSASVERRDYTRHSDGVRDVRFRSRSPPLPFEQTMNRTQFNEGFPPSEGFPIEYRRKYLLPDATDLNEPSNPGLKYIGSSGSSASRIAREKNLTFQGAGSSTLDGHGMLVQKSMYLDDGAVRKFFTLPPDVCPPINSGKIGGNFQSSSGNLNIGLREDEELRYRDNVHPNKVSVRESYKDEEESTMYYSRDVSDHMMTLSRSKAFGGTSSSLSKEEILGSYQESLPLPSDGFGRKGGKFMNPFDSARDPNVCPKDLTSYPLEPLSPDRGEPRDYSYPEFGRIERVSRRYLPDELYREMQPSARGDYAIRGSLRPGIVGPVVDRVSDPESSRRNPRDSGLWEQHSLQGEPVSNYMEVKRTSIAREHDGELLGSRSSTRFAFGLEISRDHDIIHSEGDFGFGRDAGPLTYKETLKSSTKSEFDHPDMYRLDVSPKLRLKAEKPGNYDPSERVLKRKYGIDEEMSRHNARHISTSTRNTSRRVHELTGSDERWSGEDSDGLLSSRRLNFGHLQYRKSGRPYSETIARRLSSSSDWLSSHDRPRFSSGGGDVNIKRRLKPNPFNFHNSYLLDRRQESYKTYKYWKRNYDDRYVAPKEEWFTSVKSDLPEDAEQFKQLVHIAFLRFSKQLNENPAHRRKFKEQGKAGSLLCSVCGSYSKVFVDTRSLVTHSFMSHKVGLRADHLGLHKALCVLMGWNSVVDSDSTWVHQVLPETEALALKEDLILWPPLVIIHNSSIGNNNPDERMIVTIEQMEAILRDMGFSGGKTKVLRGKPANQSIMVAKFMPTFSGLQEAERLHKYYTENKRGREEFQQITTPASNTNEDSKEVGGNHAEKVELVLYGYIGIAEDLDKLDYETKKRCVVKSKKDIQAIADAPLRAD